MSHSCDCFVFDCNHRRAILKHEGEAPPRFESFFPRDTNPLALDLLKRMVRDTDDIFTTMWGEQTI